MGRKKKIQSAVCQYCGGVFEGRPSRIKRQRFCSASCGNKGKVTESFLQKVREKRRPLSDEHKAKLWLTRDRSISEETRKKLSAASLGNKHCAGNKNRLGKPHSIETKRLISSKVPRGENHPRWRGGVSSENAIIRESIEGRTWRASVFARDNYECRKCGKRNGDHNAHHIKEFSKYPELRFDINNGMTLCEPCHKEIHGLQRRVS